MRPDTSHWRSSPSYNYIDNLGAPDLAWEWLRRNDRYQRDYAEAVHPTADTDRLAMMVRRRWGLGFPGRPIARRH
jgi:hypothetical protein